MNLHYISGFFDADGSVMLISRTKGEFKSPTISFSNTKLEILELIQNFLLINHNLKGYISTKPSKSINHNIAYDLKYSGTYAKELSKLLISFHPMKIHRLKVINKYYNLVTNKNGKYNKEQLSKKLAFERLFFIL